MVGDFVIVHGEWKEVYAFSDEVFYPEGTRNCTRFTKNFENNVNKQPFHIAKILCLQGKIISPNIKDLQLQQN